MKKGKPEVLIIGEDHPEMFVAIGYFIVREEIAVIKEFKAKRVLFELPKNKLNKAICSKLLKTRDLREFREAFLLSTSDLANIVLEELKKIFKKYGVGFKSPKNLPSPENSIDMLTMIVEKSGIFDIGFFDDLKAGAKEFAYSLLSDLSPNDILRKRLSDAEHKHSKLMLKNIKKMLVDKTVIIVGDDHVDALEKGLSEVAYLHKSKHFRVEK